MSEWGSARSVRLNTWDYGTAENICQQREEGKVGLVQIQQTCTVSENRQAKIITKIKR
jgi:hypothetical protein